MRRSRISIAISALGGQGGGVLSNWIVELAEANGYAAQYTAITGVAQRTGSTIYAIELFPQELIEAEGRDPVLSLMPVKGDVDICLASELMEAGRAVNRGIVTPDKTTLIASDHRVYAISEKENMGDGRIESNGVKDAIAKAAKKLVLFDMNAAVLKSSSVISSVLFGALAGSGTLPFERVDYEQTIQNSGRAIETNLAGFALGYDNTRGAISDNTEPECGLGFTSASALMAQIEELPDNAKIIATYGVHRLVDYQDEQYAQLYLDRLAEFADFSPELVGNISRYLALWMGFEDVIRVADLKTRADRTVKIADEIRAADGQIWYGHDYFHPRYEEFTDILPASIGSAMANSKMWEKLCSPLFNKGRILRPKTISGFLLLRFIANLRFIRLKSLRYKTENKRIMAWLALIKKVALDNPDLAIELAQCPLLIKGYGDTHAKGINRFSRIMAVAVQKRDDPEIVQIIAELRDAALLSDAGTEFNSSLKDHNTEGLTGDDAQEGEFSWAGSS